MASQCVAIYQGKRYVGAVGEGTADEQSRRMLGVLTETGVMRMHLADGGCAVFGKEARQRAVFIYHDVPEPAVEEKSSTETEQA